MSLSITPMQRWHDRWRSISVLLGTIVFAACGPATIYAGVPLAPGAASSDLQRLARRAQAGDKVAQFELGLRYEEGRGVAVDRDRAKALYLEAASPGVRTLNVYSPAVGGESLGRAVSLKQVTPGLAAARCRLEQLSIPLGTRPDTRCSNGTPPVDPIPNEPRRKD